MRKHFLSLTHLSTEQVRKLIHLAIDINKNGIKYINKFSNKSVGIYFKVNSTRTRTAFTMGAYQLGARVIAFGPDDLQIKTGESLEDTGEVLSQFLDALIVRTNGPLEDLKKLTARQQTMSLVNAMTACEHPTQVIGDMVTLHEALGKLEHVHIAYYGEGNNTTSALVNIISKLPHMRLSLFTPQHHSLSSEFIQAAQIEAKKNNSLIEQYYDPSIIPQDVDAVYTTRWETMGVKHTAPNWKDFFIPFQVNQALMNNISRHSKKEIIFMHDLPAMRGSDTASEVLDGKHSVAFRQAYHKLTGAMTVYNWIWQ